jgi:chromosome segregation ATPase
MERIESINGYFKVISDFLEGEGKRELEGLIDYWGKSNDRIRLYEKKIMQSVGNDLENFKVESAGVQEMSQELQDRTEKIKQLIETYDEISLKVEEAEKKYELKAKQLFDADKIKHMREAIANLKNELFSMNTQVGVYRGHIVQTQLREGGNAFDMYNQFHTHQEHLNDNVDESYEI